MENSEPQRDDSATSQNSCKRIIQNIVFNVTLGVIVFAGGIVVVGFSLAIPDQNKLLAVGSILLAAGIVLVVRGFLLKATQRYNERRRRRRRRRRLRRQQLNAGCNSDGSDGDIGDPPPYEEAANDSSDSASVDHDDNLNPPTYDEAIVLDITPEGTRSTERLTPHT